MGGGERNGGGREEDGDMEIRFIKYKCHFLPF